MRLYIDKANLISFLDSRRDVEYMDIYADCERMIRRQLAVQYNFPKDQCNDGGKLQAWFLNATNGCGYNESSDIFANTEDSIYPPRPIKGTFYNQASQEQISSVYLVNEQVNAIKQSHTVLIGAVGEEITILKRLFCGTDYDYHVCYDIRNLECFSGWQKLDDDGHVLPCTDIIITDRYLFKESDDIIQANLNTILRLFGQKKGAKINLVVVTKGEVDIVWQKRRQELSRAMKYNKYSSVNITFVLSHECPHDRLIITNYRMFRSGDSFNYYDSKGNLKTKGDALDVDSMAKASSYRYAVQRINNVQAIVDKLKSLNRNDLIIGDKISSWIKF